MSNPSQYKWCVFSYGTLNTNTDHQQEAEDKEGALEGEEKSSDMVDSTLSLNKKERAIQVYKRLQFLSKQNFDVMILDECHRVKNPKSATSKNIIEVGKNIPFKWGASATVSANRPEDIHHQLKAVGHPIGHMPRAAFISKYTNPTISDTLESSRSIDPTNIKNFLRFLVSVYKGFRQLPLDAQKAYAIQYAETEQDKSGVTLKDRSDQQIESLTKLQSVLILTDSYRRRTKKQIRPDLPEHYREEGFKGIEGLDGFIVKLRGRRSW
jgi:superfamily II DNA or RNA helicase